ncbi:MAG: PIN domain-containing protein [Nitrososphaerota archaeon]|nr:PIN domain-containing protein [Nitrososphaerota archaeon]MDG6912875.1 PIN domain-containing protein [Nitrososphaerota archaeon]MDG6937155.1 PIN domain-containing protein [Nitrososphaerota archaeon]MDG6961831.1 PIN domain-containing protein [Nitrososphaerota archaeon]MDG6969813.1 PIN domain-containing protein [Nitrososphaerota archaeon]
MVQTKYVVDTTILVSWLLDPGKLTGKIVKSLELELSTPYKGVDELWEHRTEWTKRRPDFDFRAFTNQIGYYVRTAMTKEYTHKMSEAKSIMDPIDPEDAEFLALAMAHGLPVWSHDPHFKKQSKVRVVTSADILRQSVDLPPLWEALQEEYFKWENTLQGRQAEDS